MTTSEVGRSGPLARPVLSLAALIAFLVLIGLGVWQVQRLRWKEGLLAEIAAAERAPAQPLAQALRGLGSGTEAVAWRRVVADCPGLDSAPYVRLYALADGGVIGWRIISPCPVRDAPYRTILVDRGFLPAEGAASEAFRPGQAPLTPGKAPSHRPVVGFLRGGETPSSAPLARKRDGNDWFERNLAGVAQTLGAAPPVAPVFLMLESPAPASGGPVPAPLPLNIPNNHLGYALTWFGLAAALAGVYVAVMRRKPDPRPSAE